LSDRALLALADGSFFLGKSIGACSSSIGEVVFNTSMTGYQEILTDPSYAQQMVTLTYPHIGNTGVNIEDEESTRVHAAGLIIRDLPLIESNFRSHQNLSEYLKKNNIVAISDIDTRQLTKILRRSGSQNGAILVYEESNENIDELIQQAINKAQSFAGLQGVDLAQVVTTDQSYTWQQGEWALGDGYSSSEKALYHVVVYDFGVKRNILRMLVSRGCKVTVVSAKTSAEDVLALNPDGIMLSNGPGDPQPCEYAIDAIRYLLLETKIPMFGICLGYQLLALAAGATTYKMKFGHHGANHPVQDLTTRKVMITSQNHGFSVDESNLPQSILVTHKSLFDQSLQGIHVKNRKAFGFQGHPEASPGPHDVSYLFDQFVEYILEEKS
jgi:carbamoyl-phosphate synthase small subunit